MSHLVTYVDHFIAESPIVTLLDHFISEEVLGVAPVNVEELCVDLAWRYVGGPSYHNYKIHIFRKIYMN